MKIFLRDFILKLGDGVDLSFDAISSPIFLLRSLSYNAEIISKLQLQPLSMTVKGVMQCYAIYSDIKSIFSSNRKQSHQSATALMQKGITF